MEAPILFNDRSNMRNTACEQLVVLCSCVLGSAPCFGPDALVAFHPGGGSLGTNFVPLRGWALQQHYLVETQANCELGAERALRAPHRGCVTYFPKILTLRSHARRRELVARPFLPRYGFVRADASIRMINATPGVIRVVTNGAPIIIPERVLDELRSREYGHVNRYGDIDYYIQLADQPLPINATQKFRRGERVLVDDERGQLLTEALFTHKIGEHRAVVFLNEIGSIIVPVSQLRKPDGKVT